MKKTLITIIILQLLVLLGKDKAIAVVLDNEIKLGTVLTDSIDMPEQISIYKFYDHFMTEINGYTGFDDYYRLLQGKSINLNYYPHRVISDPNIISNIVNELSEIKYESEAGDNFEIAGNMQFLLRPDIIYFTKPYDLLGLIIFISDDQEPVLLWINGANLIYKGKLFKTPITGTLFNTPNKEGDDTTTLNYQYKEIKIPNGRYQQEF